jgi:hypothetical protein
MKNRSLRDDSFNIRLYGLEGKSKEKQITIINKSEKRPNKNNKNKINFKA